MIPRVFRALSEKTSYCFAFLPFISTGGYFAVSYAFFIVYVSIDDFNHETLRVFGLTVAGMVGLCTLAHALGFGAFEGLGIPAGLGFPRKINAAFRDFARHGDASVGVLEGLLRDLARFPFYSTWAGFYIVLLVTIPSALVESCLSRSPGHLTSILGGGLVAGILYCYLCYLITESLSTGLRRACRKEMALRGQAVPLVYGIKLRTKNILSIVIVFSSMVMLVYFLVCCEVSVALTAVFMVITLAAVAFMVWLNFRSVKSALEEVLQTARTVSLGGGDLLCLGNNEQELAEFAEFFNDSVRETISLRENLEREVRERTRDLSAKAAELRDANERLRELDTLKSRFLASVSHELRTPLTSIMGFSKIILRDMGRRLIPELPVNDGTRRHSERIVCNLHIIQREGNRLTRLINDILDLVKIESGRMVWHDENVEVVECVEEAVEVVTGAVEGAGGISVTLEARGPLPWVRVDRDRLIQVLVNLLGNAAKFARDGDIRVGASVAPGRRIEISVADSGPGIPAEDRERIFERFHQGDGHDGKPVGTGLGLAICKEIVEHYGGRIRAESQKGTGSRFVLTLPAEQAVPGKGVFAAQKRRVPGQ